MGKPSTARFHVRAVNIDRLQYLERRGFILDWDYEKTEDESRETFYYLTLRNGIEIELTGRQLAAFQVGCMSAMAQHHNDNKVITDRALRGVKVSNREEE